MRVRKPFALGIALGLLLAGCKAKPDPTSVEDAPTPRDYIVLVDVSASRSLGMQADAQGFLRAMAKQFTFGDRLTMLQMQQSGVVDHPLRWTTQFPKLADPGYVSAHDKSRIAAAQAGVVSNLNAFFKMPDGEKVLHTDILSTLDLAAEAAHDSRPSAPTLIILSDMLQSAHGIEMEDGKRMPPVSWIGKQKQQGLVPNLQGACVLVVGADPTNKIGVTVRDFWQQYFKATGTELPVGNYRTTPPVASRNLCG